MILFVLVNKREQSPFREMFPRQHSGRHSFRLIQQSTDGLETVRYRQAENREEENSNMDSLLVKLGQEVLELFPQRDTNTSWGL